LDQFNTRIDHTFNTRHKLSFALTREDIESRNGFMSQSFPASPGGINRTSGTFYVVRLNSTLSSTLVNEFYAGAQRYRIRFLAPWELPAGQALLPKAGGQGYLPIFQLAASPIPANDDPQGRIAPFYVYGDTFTWIKNRHQLKFGGEFRFVSANGFTSFDVMPRALFGVGFGPDVVGVNAFSVPGLGINEGIAQALLMDLSGSVDRITQAFNASGGLKPAFIAGETNQRTWRQRESSFFIQDEFKLRPTVTVTLGLRHEFYGVPWDANGRTAGLVGGSTESDPDLQIPTRSCIPTTGTTLRRPWA
jgi:hypothetical protein